MWILLCVLVILVGAILIGFWKLVWPKRSLESFYEEANKKESQIEEKKNGNQQKEIQKSSQKLATS